MSIRLFADTSEIKRFERTLDANRTKQLPFIWANTLNGVAYLGMLDQREQIAKDFHEPTPASIRQAQYEKTSKAKVKRGGGSRVYLQPAKGRAKNGQPAPPVSKSSYLSPHIKGSRVVAKSGSHLISPVGIKLNDRGNIPTLSLNKPLGRKRAVRHWTGELIKPKDMVHVPLKGKNSRVMHLKPGLYWRVPRTDPADPTNLLMLVAYRKRKKHKPIYGYIERTKRSYNENLGKSYQKAATKAFATMKNTK